MTLYVIITLAVVAGPFVLSFDRRVAFHTHWKELFKAVLPVSSIYLIWDVIATSRGDWAFSSEYSGEITILSLPLGEWLFFLVVPYACIFIYEVVCAYFPARQISVKHVRTVRAAAFFAGGLFLVLAGVFISQEYTLLAMMSVSSWIVLTAVWKPHLLMEIHTLWYFLFSTAAFLIINGLLTGLPIVTYNPQAIWGVRIITIPLEDLFYNTSLLGLYLTLYTHYKHSSRRVEP